MRVRLPCEFAVPHHKRPLIGLLVHQILRRPVGIRSQFGPSTVRVHRQHERAEAEDAELVRVALQRTRRAVDRRQERWKRASRHERREIGSDCRLLEPARRTNVEYPTWATVHGLAVLLRGPLRSLSDREKMHLEAQTLAFIAASLS